jgi:hypothetical protein
VNGSHQYADANVNMMPYNTPWLVSLKSFRTDTRHYIPCGIWKPPSHIKVINHCNNLSSSFWILDSEPTTTLGAAAP